MRSNSISGSNNFRGGGSGMPLTPNMVSPAASPSSMTSISRGSFSSAAVFATGGAPSVAFGKRSSIFAPPPAQSLSIQAQLQRSVFAKMQEEIYTVLQVIPRSKPPLDVLASFGSAPSPADDQAYFLVLTTNQQVKKSADGFGAPKLHWVKIKQSEQAGGEVSYSYKKFKLLKLLKRIEMSGSSMTTGGSMVGGGASGTLRREKEEFTLVFRSGDTDKFYSFALKTNTSVATTGGPVSPTAAVHGQDRSIFVWYCLEICRSYCGFVPTSNIDTVLYQQLTNEIAAFYLSEPAPPNVPAHVRSLVNAVSKNRTATAEHHSKQLTRSKVEEKVIVPSMTAEETQLVQFFLKQIEQAQPAGARSTDDAGSTSTHSHLNELESFLLHKLTVIEHQNIQSLFDPKQEAQNARILQDDIQTNLLDNKLEEMSLWINHHNIELTKMKKGIELIEKRNMNLDIQEKNQTQLYDSLKEVLDSLKLDADPARAAALEQLLEHPDFGSGSSGGGQLATTLHAVKQLDHVIQLEIGDGKLEDLRALKEQRAKYAIIRAKFSKQAEVALENIFLDIARRAVEQTQREVTDMATLQTNGTIHRDLRRYMELLRYLERLEFGVFLNLRTKYCSAVRSVYEVKTRLYFASLRKAIAQEHKDTHLQHFPDWTLELARAASRRTEGGRNISTSANATHASTLKLGPNASLPASQTGRILATQAFVQAMANLTPSCLSEERFVREFFGATKDTPTTIITVTSASPTAKDPPTHTKNNSSSNFSLTLPLTAVRGPRPSISSGSAHGGHGRSDAEEIESMMQDLFRGLEPELRDLSTAASKMDHFYTLEMLVQCERIMQDSAPLTPTSASASGLSSCEFLESIITSLSTHLKLSFTSFIDTEIEWFSSLKPNPKRCGVLTPMLKFPALVDRMENIVWRTGIEGSKVTPGTNTRSQAADTSYQKLASALFRWLDGVAKSDEKYTDLVYMENAHFFVQLFTTPHLSVPALEQFVAKAETKYQEHTRSYVAWSIEYEMPTITKFWSKLEEQLKSIQPEDIPFASELSKHDLRAVLKGPLSSKVLHKSLTNVLKRVEKHMPKNPAMIQTVWSQISGTFLSKLSHFEQLVNQCYQNEKLTMTVQETEEMFHQLLPVSAANRPAAHA